MLKLKMRGLSADGQSRNMQILGLPGQIVKVLPFTKWDQNAGEIKRSEYAATREAIASFGGSVVEGAEYAVLASDLDDYERILLSSLQQR